MCKYNIVFLFIKMTKGDELDGNRCVYSSSFTNDCTRCKIESSRKVFIKYDPIIHGTAATTRPCPRASLLITRIPTFSTAHEDADLSVTQIHVCTYTRA